MKFKFINSISLFVIVCLFASQFAYSQESIKTFSALKKKSNYNFSADWQYLSTDLYLLNSTKFSQLLHDIAVSGSDKKKKKSNNEMLQSLFIKAKISNLKFFGGDIVYPIYNFKVSEDKNYTTVETGNVEVVRLIDNLPLNESNEVIDAEISGEAITQKNSDEFLKLIAHQLQGFSKVTKPNLAILDLIGELGKYIESKTTGKQYKFSSTIRLYEGQDFNKRLHSVNVFVLAPSSLSRLDISADHLIAFLDTSANPQVDMSILEKLITYKKYPTIVCVNYKSRYNSHPVIGDQINFEYLAERKLKIQNAYQNELLNKFTYNQELKLIEFLEIFSDLKLNINNYKLNLKNNITNDYSKNLFVILKIYRKLLNTKKMRMIEFSNNPEFKNEFLSKYLSVINTAGLYLNENNALSAIKEAGDLVENGFEQNIYDNNTEIYEKNLRLLYSVNIPEDEIKSEMAIDLFQLVNNIEKLYSSKIYYQLIQHIKSLGIDESGLKEKEGIEARYGNTYCVDCRKMLSDAIGAYNSTYQKAQRNSLIRKNEEIGQKTLAILFGALQKRKCIDQYLQKDSLSDYNDLITIELNKIDTLIKDTRETLKSDINIMNVQQLQEQNFLLEAYIKRIETGLENFCRNLAGICNCENEE